MFPARGAQITRLVYEAISHDLINGFRENKNSFGAVFSLLGFCCFNQPGGIAENSSLVETRCSHRRERRDVHKERVTATSFISQFIVIITSVICTLYRSSLTPLVYLYTQFEFLFVFIINVDAYMYVQK